MEDATYGLLVLLSNLFYDKQHRHVFGTPAVRDCIFVARVKSVSEHRSVVMFFRALLPILSKDSKDRETDTAGVYPRAALFRTQIVRDTVFIPLARLVSDEETLLHFLACLREVVREEATKEKTALVFGTKAVRDRLFVPLVKYVTTEKLAEVFSTAVGAVARGCAPDSVWFTTTTLRDRVLLPLVKYSSSPTVSSMIACTMVFIEQAMSSAPMAMPVHMAEMRDLLVALTREVVTSMRASSGRGEAATVGVDGEHFCNAVVRIITRRALSSPHPFAASTARDEIIIPLGQGNDDLIASG